MSRVKANAVIYVQQAIEGIPVSFVGKHIGELTFRRANKKIVEFVGEVGRKGNRNSYRVIGFWNPVDRHYHWYITNLAVTAKIIYPLYRIRWQLELIFKGCKQSLNLDQRLTSNNNNIIESLVLTSIIASFASQVVLNIGTEQLTKKQKLAISFQRIASIVHLLANDFIYYLTRSPARYAQTLVEQINLFAIEMIEKNHQHRAPALAQLSNAFDEYNPEHL